MKCWVCGKEYSKKDIQPVWFYNENSKKWLDVNKITYKGEEIPLCNTHLRLLSLNTLMEEHYLIDLKH